MDRDPTTGKFIKGNKAGQGKEDLREMRTAIKDELVKCAHSLLKPWHSLKTDTAKKKVSRYQYLMNKAVANNDTKFISWITEMVIGRAKNTIKEESDENSPNNGNGVVFIPYEKEHQKQLVKMALNARMQKIKEEKKGII